MKTTAKQTPTEYPQRRASAGLLRLAHQPVAGSPAASMAAAIIRRYMPSGEWAGFPEQVLREHPRMAITQQITNRVQLHYTPRLALAFNLGQSGRLAMAAPQTLNVIPIEPGNSKSENPFTLRQDRLSVLVERLVRRGVRIDGLAEVYATPGTRQPAAAPNPEPAAAPLLAEIPPVRKVFQRQTPTPPAPAAPPAGDMQASALSLRPTPAPRTAETAHPTANLDINLLTEQVVRTIDRRIIAQRERLGRV